jgi:prepilin-type N-terminal cleavage/methylation domain-containing protein
MNASSLRIRRRLLPSRIAFTLTELLVVIAIIGILASSVLFAMWGASKWPESGGRNRRSPNCTSC